MVSYEVRHIEGKGQGLVATQKIPRGSVILTDTPILSVECSNWDDRKTAQRAIEAALNRISKPDQAIYLSLYEGRPEHPESSAARIFHTNSFESADGSKFVLPLISRLNHSCVPNAVAVDRDVHAQKDILSGEEIQICYKETWDEVLTASQRNFLYKHRYGFECRCKACLPSAYGRLSDCRRLLIGALRFGLEGQQPVDFRLLSQLVAGKPNADSLLRDADWPPKVPCVTLPHSPSQQIEYTFLLAKLREAEGLNCMRVARTFFEAASLLLELQRHYGERGMVRHTIVLFVESFRCHEAWMKKAVHHAACAGGPTGQAATSYRIILQDMQLDSVLMCSKQMIKKDISNGDQKKKCYVVAMDAQKKKPPKYLTLSESEKLFGRN
ncbi:unnamed protein product [Zymoseptoria tritici ST99CH_3D7]|uniref:SET domain-containing protein n=1 Tax=Zymoseptoria tritici (strain ST99CH_3D7) TaxID=1276538 RepID=A0A1X7RX00_ZYMT9|nr:unnamed protein product [Zymoseptoria tritici ST99CH_3D7]